MFVREAAKVVFSGPATKRGEGEGLRGRATFFFFFFFFLLFASSEEEGGGGGGGGSIGPCDAKIRKSVRVCTTITLL